jgi:hypothetical protein
MQIWQKFIKGSRQIEVDIREAVCYNEFLPQKAGGEIDLEIKTTLDEKSSVNFLRSGAEGESPKRRTLF